MNTGTSGPPISLWFTYEIFSFQPVVGLEQKPYIRLKISEISRIIGSQYPNKLLAQTAPVTLPLNNWFALYKKKCTYKTS